MSLLSRVFIQDTTLSKTCIVLRHVCTQDMSDVINWETCISLDVYCVRIMSLTMVESRAK